MDRSILFFNATSTAVRCSHALPITGSSTTPMKWMLSPESTETSRIESVRNSVDRVMRAVMTVSTAMEPGMLRWGRGGGGRESERG